MNSKLSEQEQAASYNLTKEEARSFLEKVLSITDSHQKIAEDRLAFLNIIMHTMHHTIPYQNLTRCSVPHKDRHAPSFSVIMEHMFKKYGGTCKILQTFFKCLIDALGYRADFCNVMVPSINQDHVGIIAHDLTSDGSRHIVDVGCVYPTFEAIPLDFEDESPVYSVSFLRYKFKKRPDGIVEWFHESRQDKTKWFKFAEIEASKYVPVSFFFKTTERDFTDPTNPFNTKIRISHYKENCFFAVKGKVIKWSEKKEKILLTREVETTEEVRAILIQEFPQFPIEMIEQAILHTM